MSSSTDKSSVPSESDIYDRQIRLWGADAQSKMSSAKVLYIHISGVSSEVLKNLILAGIRGAILDGRTYPDAVAETPTSFLPPEELCLEKKSNDGNDSSNNGDDNGGSKRIKRMTVAKAIQPHVEELNPLLKECEIHESEDIDTIPDDYFAKFDIIVASNIGLDSAIRIANACKATTETKKETTKFYLVHSFGYYACALMDLGEDHTYRREMGKDKLSNVMSIKPYTSLEAMMKIQLADAKDRWHKTGPPMIYTKYRTLLNYYRQKKGWPAASNSEEFTSITKDFLKEQGLEENYLGDDDALKELAVTADAEVSPVCAVIGGVLGNEVIKAISGKGEPANNVLMFDGLDGGCRSFVLK